MLKRFFSFVLALSLLVGTSTVVSAQSVTSEKVAYGYGKVLMANLKSLNSTIESMDSIANEISDNEGWRVKAALLSGRIRQMVDQAYRMNTPTSELDQFHSAYLKAIKNFDRAATSLKEGALNNSRSDALQGLDYMKQGGSDLAKFGEALQELMNE